MRIAVGADHAGVPLNERIIEELRRSGHEIVEIEHTDGKETFPPFDTVS